MFATHAHFKFLAAILLLLTLFLFFLVDQMDKGFLSGAYVRCCIKLCTLSKLVIAAELIESQFF